MTGIEIAGLLKDYGPWGISALLILAVHKLYKDKEALHTARIEEMKQIVKAVEGFKDAIEGNAEALVGVRNTLETRAQALVDLSHQFERAAQDTRHSFANLSQMLTGFLDWLRRDRPGGSP